MNYCLVVTTTSNKEEADSLTKKILDNKLAACVSVSEIESSYFWDGKIESSLEFKLEIKTREDKIDRLKEFVKKNHSYEVPEIIVLPIVDGNRDYFNWIDESVGS